MDEATRPQGYSTTQIMLHWSVATLVVFQFFVNDGIAEAWRSYRGGEEVGPELLAAANVHVIIGLTILVLAAWRVWLRLAHGAPPPPENEPAAMRLAASATHVALYVLIVVTPLSGAAAWFLGLEAAASVHGLSRILLFLLSLLHVAGALVQLFVLGSGVFSRMLMTKD